MPKNPSLVERLAQLHNVGHDIPWSIVAQIGKVRPYTSKGGETRYLIDLRPLARIWKRPNEHFFETERDAERVLDAIRETMRREKKSLVEAAAPYLPAKAKPILVPTRLKVWMQDRHGATLAGDLSPNTTDKLIQYAKPDGAFAFWNNRSIFDITTASVMDYNTWLRDEYGKRGKRISKKTRSNILGAFRPFVRWLKHRKEIMEMPEFPDVQPDEVEIKYVSIEDQDLILSSIPDEARGIFLAMARCGLRPNEARAILMCDLMEDPNGGYWFFIRKAMKGATLSAPMGSPKTKRPRKVPVHPDVIDWLVLHPTPLHLEQPLFRNPDKQAKDPMRRWAHITLTRRWERACKKAGIKISLYPGTKHSMATDALERDIDIYKLAEFLGHADLRSTKRYTKVTDRGLRAVLRPVGQTTGRQAPEGKKSRK